MKSWPLLVVLVLSLVLALPAAASPGAPKAPGACTPSTGTWAAGPSFGTVMTRAWGAFYPPNGKFYAMGGRVSDSAGSDLLNPREYDPATSTWTIKTASFPNNEVNNMVGGVLDFGSGPVIVVVGGSAAGAATATATVKVYDPVADTMTVLAADNWPGNAGGATLPGGAAVYNNKLYVVGGFIINVSMYNGIWEFDPMAASGSRWTQQAATLPVPVGYVPAATIGANIYLAGGSEWDGTTLVDSANFYRYDPVADTITTLPNLPRATGETRAVRMIDDTLWVLGGGRTAPNPNGQVDIYDPATSTWTIGPSMITPRRNIAADINPVSGTIYTAGGYDSSGFTLTDVTEIFTACVPTSVTVSSVEATSGAYGLWALAIVAGVLCAALALFRRARA